MTDARQAAEIEALATERFAAVGQAVLAALANPASAPAAPPTS